VLREPLAIPLREARAPLVLALDIGTSGLRVSCSTYVDGRSLRNGCALADRTYVPAAAAAHARLRAGMECQRQLEEVLAPLMS
jgi:hypothetical protein